MKKFSIQFSQNFLIILLLAFDHSISCHDIGIEVRFLEFEKWKPPLRLVCLPEAELFDIKDGEHAIWAGGTALKFDKDLTSRLQDYFQDQNIELPRKCSLLATKYDRKIVVTRDITVLNTYEKEESLEIWKIIVPISIVLCCLIIAIILMRKMLMKFIRKCCKTKNQHDDVESNKPLLRRHQAQGGPTNQKANEPFHNLPWAKKHQALKQKGVGKGVDPKRTTARPARPAFYEPGFGKTTKPPGKSTKKPDAVAKIHRDLSKIVDKSKRKERPKYPPPPPPVKGPSKPPPPSNYFKGVADDKPKTQHMPANLLQDIRTKPRKLKTPDKKTSPKSDGSPDLNKRLLGRRFATRKSSSDIKLNESVNFERNSPKKGSNKKGNRTNQRALMPDELLGKLETMVPEPTDSDKVIEKRSSEYFTNEDWE